MKRVALATGLDDLKRAAACARLSEGDQVALPRPVLANLLADHRNMFTHLMELGVRPAGVDPRDVVPASPQLAQPVGNPTLEQLGVRLLDAIRLLPPHDDPRRLPMEDELQEIVDQLVASTARPAGQEREPVL